MQISFQSVLKIVKLVLVIQVFNAFIDYLMWMAYGDSVSGLTIVAFTFFYTVLFLAIKVAIEREEALSL
jgi:uncharacterized phage infection (PIP) family protein YhgE